MVVLMTAAARAIGQAISVGPAERGATVVIGDIDDLSQTATLIADTGGTADLVTVDISDPTAIDAVRQRVSMFSTPPDSTSLGSFPPTATSRSSRRCRDDS